MKVVELQSIPMNGAVRRFMLVIKILAFLSAVAIGGNVKG